MLGAIIGDVVGSAYEFRPVKTIHFPLLTSASRFTDDTVLTIALAQYLLTGQDYIKLLKEFTHAYPAAGFGGRFFDWAFSDKNEPYQSYGNGSAMRVSPVGFAFSTREEILTQAEKSAAVTHDHPEGIKGAQAVALAIFLAKHGSSRDEIKNDIEMTFKYDLHQTLEEIRPSYGFDETCLGSVPQAIIAFLESTSYESAIRNAVSLGGDADTQACIAGGIAEAFYKKIPSELIQDVRQRLPTEFIEIIDRFYEEFI